MSLLSRLRSVRTGREPAVFVVGMNRSGTTLLRMMLDAHPQLTIPPETHFVPDLIKATRTDGATAEDALEAMKSAREWGDFGFSDEQMLERLRALPKIKPGPAVRTFYEAYMEQQGKPRWGEKTPTYVQKMKLIQRALPEARFVHVIRDGRDVALSVLDRTVRDLTAADVARRWKRKITKAREDSPQLEHYIEVRYEDLILDTEPVLRRVCEFIELPWDDAMLDYHERSGERLQEMARALPGDGRAQELSVERRMATHAMTTKPPSADRVARWRTEMSAEQRTEFESVAGTCSTSSVIRPARCRRAGNDSDRRGARARRLTRTTGREAELCGLVGDQVVRERPGGRRAPDALRPGRARARDVRAREAGQGPRAQQERVADPVWDQPGVTHADEADIPEREYLAWVRDHGIEAILCDQNDQFAEITAVRREGVRTIGRFVWESFPPEDAAPAKEAFDVIYSVTRAEQERYRGFGIDSPLLTWGCHPELIAIGDERRAAKDDSPDGEVRFYVPGSFMGKRKPFPRSSRRSCGHRPPAAADPRPGRPQGGQAGEGGGR